MALPPHAQSQLVGPFYVAPRTMEPSNPESILRAGSRCDVKRGASDPALAPRRSACKCAMDVPTPSHSQHAVNGMVERTARKARINETVIAALAAPCTRLACHLPRRLAAQGAVDAGPRQHRHHISLPAARPNRSSGLHLDPGVFLR